MSDVWPLSFHPVDDLPKEIKGNTRFIILAVMRESESVSAWIKARI